MSTHRYFDRICCVVLAFTVLLTLFFLNAERFGVQKTEAAPDYESRLFDSSRVHFIDIVMDDWDEFAADCKSEEYHDCSIVIDDEVYKNVAIRGKGNTSLMQVESYGNDRYSFKIEFDYYDSAKSYYGLDKLCLNNIIQDNTYMKDYLVYQMMLDMGVASPLCSYVYITVNGEDWGLYLAVEGVEEAFLARNYGGDYGELYKPDSVSMGGGEGFGGGMPGKGVGGGSDDVLLKYIDDDADSYANIFDHAKTDITNADKTRLIRSLKYLNSGENLESVVDIDAFIRYFVVHNFVLNFDSYTGSMIHNYYLHEKDGQMQMIPWDYNLAFGGFDPADSAERLVNYPIDSPVSGGDTEDRPMIAWIFENEMYTELYHQYFDEFLSEYFESGYFENMMESVKSMIAPFVERDPTKFCTYEEFETGIETLRAFCLLRAESVRGQLDGTIGAAFTAQNEDSLIEAGNLRISDMGSMMDGAGGMPPEMPERAAGRGVEPPEMPEGAADPGIEPPDMQMRKPDADIKPGDMGREAPFGQRGFPVSALIRGAVSVIILMFGICFAVLYGRKRG